MKDYLKTGIPLNAIDANTHQQIGAIFAHTTEIRGIVERIEKRLDTHEDRILELEKSKSQVVGGWKTIMGAAAIGGAFAKLVEYFHK